MNKTSGTTCKNLNAITNKIIVSANFIFEPWLKLRATSSFLLAPAYRKANAVKTIFGKILIKAPVAAELAVINPPTSAASATITAAVTI